MRAQDRVLVLESGELLLMFPKRPKTLEQLADCAARALPAHLKYRTGELLGLIFAHLMFLRFEGWVEVIDGPDNARYTLSPAGAEVQTQLARGPDIWAEERPRAAL